MKTQHDESGHN
jgi:hypothetical protein